MTVVAWLFIALSGFATFISLLQNLMVAAMPRATFTEALRDTTFTNAMPAGPRFVFAHFHLIIVVMFVVCVATLISSIGLLRRRNWARLVFMALLSLGVLYNIGVVFVQQSMMASFDASFPANAGLGPDSQQFAHLFAALKVAVFVFELGFAALFCWIIVRLRAAPIRAEFTS